MSDDVNPNELLAEIFVKATQDSLASVARPLKNTIRRTLHLISDAYAPFLNRTKLKVQSIRTFLKPTESVDLLDHYVPVNLLADKIEIEVDSLIDRLTAGERFVISALAGSGKSVLMRFVALSYFHHPRGKIPLFFELRSLNLGEDVRLLESIHEYYRGNSSVELEDFLIALRNGYFVLILDGFDEISPSNRNSVESQILRICRDYPNLAIVISGRHDERFNSWEPFTHFRLKELNISQAREVIRRSNYDEVVKETFLDRLTEEFFEQHQSFLENPLLAIMMMLTFEGYAEIPDSLHEFYRIAFDTLIRRHDALKGQFLRETHSGCSTEQLKQIFSSFCLLTHSKSAFSFDRDKALTYLNAAIRQQGNDIDAAKLLIDLIESICLLQEEGFEISFVHRSFQEYFCAVYVANSATGFVKRYLDSSNTRHLDSVLPMLMGIAEQRVESEWACDKVNELRKNFPANDRNSSDRLLLDCFPNLEFILHQDEVYLNNFKSTKFYRELLALKSLYAGDFTAGLQSNDFEDEGDDYDDWQVKIKGALLDLEESGHPDLVGFSIRLSNDVQAGEPGGRLSVNIDENCLGLLRAVFGNHYDMYPTIFDTIRESQLARSVRSSDFLQEVFGDLP